MLSKDPLNTILLIFINFSVKTLFTTYTHSHLSRTFSFARVVNLFVFKLREYIIHLFLNKSVLFSSFVKEKLSLSFKLVNFCNLLGTIGNYSRLLLSSQVKVVIILFLFWLRKSFGCFVYEFQMFLLYIKKRLFIKILISSQVI